MYKSLRRTIVLLCPPPIIINGLILTFCSTITVIKYMDNTMKLQVTGYRGYIITNEARMVLEGIKINSVLSLIKRIKNKSD
ncbi:hypothetical protein B4R02_14340 [Salmonella enterica]|nr:hypothetical protein [Salmonella enterica]EBE3720184.1 hypothetical protein [Salmonella enterica subsp. diarizonae serovar 42:l,v:1,5,7]ECE0793251.1 hypothetical protein [Salmonella enterica subsp. diarizonae]ECO0851126.1 hypothetical protein [Salmonella enterica subsp. enterica serovar Newport]ECQ8979542.1 hypothetical protein [Salmonella enterica subsp. enterica]EDU6369163.1 hypothetical protein [Salmonella enterica subsp. houtenae serovar 40:z4,z24:-]